MRLRDLQRVPNSFNLTFTLSISVRQPERDLLVHTLQVVTLYSLLGFDSSLQGMTTALRSFILFLGQAIIACIPVLAVIANCVVVQRVAWRPAAAEKTG